MPKHKVHHPSQHDIILDCAKEVCERLAQNYGPSYISQEVIYGVSGFLQVAVSILSEQAHTACETEDKVDEQPE